MPAVRPALAIADDSLYEIGVMPTLKIARVRKSPNPMPSYQSEHAAGLDLLAAVPADAPVVIAPGGRAMIPTGIFLS